MLVKETEITLSSGEQVMPVHEHGVEDEGSQVEKTEDEERDFEGSKESRACPSGERQETTHKIEAMFRR